MKQKGHNLTSKHSNSKRIPLGANTKKDFQQYQTPNKCAEIEQVVMVHYSIQYIFYKEMTHGIKRFQPFFTGLEMISLKGRRKYVRKLLG